eukprot:669391_1
MAQKLFADKEPCALLAQDTLNCKAMNRIKIILNEFDDSNFMKKFASIFIDNNYTNTSLLNDFHHVKYTHHADDDDCVFEQIFSYITEAIDTRCDGKNANL